MRIVETTFLLLIALSLLGFGSCSEEIMIPGLEGPVSVVTDLEGVPHISAENDLDAARAQGYVHARDRFFQMDLTRREVSGDLAELVGSSAIGGDVQSRTIGLRRAAVRSGSVLSARELAILQAYADGVNAWLDSNPLPPEYAALELTAARPWDPIDSLVIGKAIAASLSLDIDIGLTLELQSFIGAGIAGGFDGQALLFEDVVRSAPMDPASTVPDATGSTPFLAAISKIDASKLAGIAAGAKRIEERLKDVPLFRPALERRETHVGSNEWGVSGANSSDGRPIIANDPHLSLNAPSTFYEWHLRVDDDPIDGDMNVSGVGFPGTPGVILGQNDHITWGATTNPMDVSDIFLDTVIVDPFVTCASVGALACILSEGVVHPIDVEFGVTYFFNVIGDSIDDNLVAAALPPENQIIATVPFRSFGPVLDITDPSVLTTGGVTTALVLQYTGFHATRELSTFAAWNRARNLSEFLDGLDDFDVGSQNWAYADVDGNLGYFSSAEIPLRADLEQGTVAGGIPPFLIRDGSGPSNWIADPARSQGQAIPYAVLPYAEMPQALNPTNGFFVNANNDPAGTTLDNDPLNQVRTSKPGAIYYLNPGYADGLRAGRITRLVQGKLDAGELISVGDMKRFQSNTQQLDAELLTPFLLAAFAAAQDPGAAAELAAFAADAEVAEAVGRLTSWDFSSPTGIPEGYDAHDTKGNRTPGVPTPERNASVAATIYNVWRAKAVQGVIDARLAAIGAPSVGSRDAVKALHHLLSSDPYTGVGASGVDFVPQPAALGAEERRDVALLTALREGLDALAGPAFANAFGGSTDQDDYRWGRLHRIVFDHPTDPSLSIPPLGGFDHLDEALGLLGVSRDGGYEVVNASGFSGRSDAENEFRFGGGPVRRYVGTPRFPNGSPGMRGFNVMPGGPSGIPGDPAYATQLGDWLTADYHPVNMSPIVPGGNGVRREVFVPSN
jgi:penicillin amidase